MSQVQMIDKLDSVKAAGGWPMMQAHAAAAAVMVRSEPQAVPVFANMFYDSVMVGSQAAARIMEVR